LFQFWIFPTIALSIFFLDHLFRYFKRFFIQAKLIEITLPTHNAMFLTFKVNDKITIRPGQYVLIQCENLSTLEWHPFYVIDHFIEPHQTIFTLAIGIRGDWTSELYEKLFEVKLHAEKVRRRKSSLGGKGRRHRGSSIVTRKLAFVMDGPFPNQAESILESERVVLIGMGIGVTPYISIFNYIM
jgi:respiratory burst oxidase